MKNIIRFGVAGALMAGYVTAQAQAPLPSSGSADLWLFVSNPATSTTFAEDTGLSINSIVGTTFTPNAVLNTSIQPTINLGPTGALTAYINAANAAGQALQWSVEAMEFPSTVNHQNAGKIVGMTDNPASQATTTSNMQYLNLQNWANGFNTDVTYLAKTYVTGGASYAWSAGSATGTVWQPGVTGNKAGSTDLYGQGPDASGIAPGATMNLYALTGNGGTGQLQSYLLSTGLTMKADGTLTTSAVPLPAAVWLFGSGLLGLIGVGRRRAAAV
jgi:hypothetical protein